METNTATCKSVVSRVTSLRRISLTGLGYASAAQQLQKHWNLSPEDLPFASLVSRNALISLVQDGLLLGSLSAGVYPVGEAFRSIPFVLVLTA